MFKFERSGFKIFGRLRAASSFKYRHSKQSSALQSPVSLHSRSFSHSSKKKLPSFVKYMWRTPCSKNQLEHSVFALSTWSVLVPVEVCINEHTFTHKICVFSAIGGSSIPSLSLIGVIFYLSRKGKQIAKMLALPATAEKELISLNGFLYHRVDGRWHSNRPAFLNESDENEHLAISWELKRPPWPFTVTVPP